MSPTDGAIILWKPAGISSAKALYRVRTIMGVRKSGHAGTLDPSAEGVLIICQGRATRLVERVMALTKVYRAVARLDVTSESLDADSEMTPVSFESLPSEDVLTATLRSFEGESEQTPPKISAVKINGVPAYKLARKGRAVSPRPKMVRIDQIRLLGYDWPEVEFEMTCGRGTYVRSLVRDVGRAMGTGGCLISLIRSAIGPFDRSQAMTPERLQTANPDERLIPMDRFQAILDASFGN